MNRAKLKEYARQARREFIQAVTDRAAYYGLTPKKTEPIIEKGDVALIGGKAFPRSVAQKRKALEERILRHGLDQVMETMAYTWFNRLVAIRFMELHGYLDHGYRVVSHPEGEAIPEILEHAEHVDLPGLDRSKVIELKLEGTKEDQLYRLILIAQCNALHSAMPFLFEWIDDETELLLPNNLLHSDSLIRKLVNEIDEEDWQEVEIIGWLYQFYISEKKDQVIGKVVKSEDIPAATQLFTPNWIVKYLVQNTLGRHWLATYPNSPLRQQMAYYIEPANQTPEVQAQLKAITPERLNPEEITLLDPAPGSGHILVEAYDLFKSIYQERGYPAKDIPTLILQKNLFGLEICNRAVQLAAFALMMKARADDRHIFDRKIQPNVLAIQESKGLDARKIAEALNVPPDRTDKKGQKGNISEVDLTHLIDLFEHGKTFGSLIRVPENLADKLPAIIQRIEEVLTYCGIFEQTAANSMKSLVQQAWMLATNYDVVVANPPYMGGRNGMNPTLKAFAEKCFPDTKADLFSMFIERGFDYARSSGYNAMVTMQSWMFLSSFETMRERLLASKTLLTMAHLGPRAFSSISGEVVQTTAFIYMNARNKAYSPLFFRLVDGEEDTKRAALLERKHCFCGITQEDFGRIPGRPLAYWMPHVLVKHLIPENQLLNYSDQRQGLATGDDDRFLRYWHEIDASAFNNTNIAFPNREKRWFPFIKGGTFRKWYGNNEFVIRFDEESFSALENQGNCLPNRHLYMKESLVWSDVAASVFGARFNTEGKVFGTGALSAFPKKESLKFYILGYLNSCIHDLIINSISSGLHYHTGYVSKSPLLLSDAALPLVSKAVREAIDISRRNWDSFETSWDFKSVQIFRTDGQAATVANAVRQYTHNFEQEFSRLKELEEENNRQFLHVYGLDAQIPFQVAEKDVTLSMYDASGCVRCIVSFAFGCMMGRYSLDKPGLIYAHSNNKGFDSNQYKTFTADPDGIIPIMEGDWFPDDATNRLIEFIGVAWPKEYLEENLKFISESLDRNRDEEPRKTIRRYLANGFFKDHLKKYKRRPIYWLFSSGKLRAFQCLVYLHRYNESTLSRMRTEYVIPLQGKIASRIEQLADEIQNATSMSHRKKMEKERDTLIKQQAELQSFDEKLRHFADLRISLDLDDGVKVNYGKFGDLLAEVKTVTGGNDE